MISLPLREFAKTFKLSVGKEVMPYDIYTEENIKKIYIHIDEVLKRVKKEDRQQFVDNINKWNILRPDGTYDIIQYSSNYCEIDCTALHQGNVTFQGWMQEYTGLNIDNYITIMSLASDYIAKEGCNDEVAKLLGIVQHYISQCVVGGRRMTIQHKMYHVVKKIADFDACSLYPSAMNRIDGFLLGEPMILQSDQLSYDFLKKQDGYFIRVLIKKVGKERNFLLLSTVSDSGARVFNNDMVDKEIHIIK